MTRAILYLRQSDSEGEGERSLSLDSQETALRALAAERGWAVAGVVREPDRKGWMDESERAGIAEALARAARREYDVLAFYDLSRFARSVRIQETLIHRLAAHGVGVVSAREPWVEQPLFRQIIAAINEEQTRTIAAHLRRAFAERARRGQHHCGQPPYGWRQRDTVEVEQGGAVAVHAAGPLVPDEAEGPIVVEAFARADAGEPLWRIVGDFAARGVPTKRGGPWTVTTLRRILACPAHAGDVSYRGQVVARDAHPPLIARAQWARVQARLAGQALVRRKDHGLASWCEGRVAHACGGRMYLVPIQGKRRRDGTRALYPNFVCGARYQHTPGCPVRPATVSARKLERAVRRCLVADLAGRGSLDAAVARAEAAAGGDDAARARRALADRQRLADQRHARARERWLAGREPSSWMDEEDARHDAERTAIAAELAALPAAPDPARYRAIGAMLDGFAGLVAGVSDEALGRVLAEVGVAVVDNRGVTIRYHPGYADYVPSPVSVCLHGL